MKTDCFDAWLQLNDENRCNKCNSVTNVNNPNDYKACDDNNIVTLAKKHQCNECNNAANQYVSVTPVTQLKNSSVTTNRRKEVFKINSLSKALHTLHQLHQKNNHIDADVTGGKLKQFGVDINLKDFLDEDWELYKDDREALICWFELLVENQMIICSIAPDRFIAVTHCSSCGDIFVPPEYVNGGQVLSCPWCYNRFDGLPIPRPERIH